MEPLGSFPRVLNVLPREKIEGPPRDFLKATPRPHPRPDQRPKTRGAIGPRVFGLWSRRGWGQGFAFRKFQRGPSIFFQEYIEYSRDFLRTPFTMIPLRLSHRFSFFLPNALVYYVNGEKQSNKLFSNGTLGSSVVNVSSSRYKH